jgi:hypothetical protein
MTRTAPYIPTNNKAGRRRVSQASRSTNTETDFNIDGFGGGSGGKYIPG